MLPDDFASIRREHRINVDGSRWRAGQPAKVRAIDIRFEDGSLLYEDNALAVGRESAVFCPSGVVDAVHIGAVRVHEAETVEFQPSGEQNLSAVRRESGVKARLMGRARENLVEAGAVGVDDIDGVAVVEDDPSAVASE